MIPNELLHVREYRVYKTPDGMSISEVLSKIRTSMPNWTIHYSETIKEGMIFRLESPISKLLP